MLDRVQRTGRMRSVAAIAASVALFGLAARAEAGPAECRARIGKESRILTALGARSVDQCHRKRDQVCAQDSMRGECNILPSSNTDPKGTYDSRATKALLNIAGDCTGSPVLANYPGGVQTAVLDKIVDEITGNSQVSLGAGDLLCEKQVVACHRAIARARSTVIKEVVTDSVKCQRDLDKHATTFGAISAACLDDGSRTAATSKLKITKNCTGADLGEVDSCSTTLANLDDCVVNSAISTGQDLAKAVYGAPTGCGNGAVGPGEQCDDGNTVSGDGCNASCELEGNSCTPYVGAGGGTGTRLVKVAINTPEALAGVQVALNYPQFEAGIPGIGTSGVVQGRFQALQPAGLALLNDDGNTSATVGMVNVVDLFNSGDLFQVTMDNCVQLSQNICNRNQQVFGCGGLCLPGGTVCFNNGQCNPGATCDFGNQVVCSPATNLPFGPGPQTGCCPADNACFTQTAATGCAVSDPVDALGQPVAGVTCSVTVTEQP
jgi:cysteine-rich repeat protein